MSRIIHLPPRGQRTAIQPLAPVRARGDLLLAVAVCMLCWIALATAIGIGYAARDLSVETCVGGVKP